MGGRGWSDLLEAPAASDLEGLASLARDAVSERMGDTSDLRGVSAANGRSLLELWPKSLHVDLDRRQDVARIDLDPRGPSWLLPAEVWVLATEGAALALYLRVRVAVAANWGAYQDVFVHVLVRPPGRLATVAPTARVRAASQAHRQNTPRPLIEWDISETLTILLDRDGEMRPSRSRLRMTLLLGGRRERWSRQRVQRLMWRTVPRVVAAKARAALLRVWHGRRRSSRGRGSTVGVSPSLPLSCRSQGHAQAGLSHGEASSCAARMPTASSAAAGRRARTIPNALLRGGPRTDGPAHDRIAAVVAVAIGVIIVVIGGAAVARWVSCTPHLLHAPHGIAEELSKARKAEKQDASDEEMNEWSVPYVSGYGEGYLPRRAARGGAAKVLLEARLGNPGAAEAVRS